VKKIFIGLILFLAIIFTVFASGEKEVLSSASPSQANNINQEDESKKEEDSAAENNPPEVVEEKLPLRSRLLRI